MFFKTRERQFVINQTLCCQQRPDQTLFHPGIDDVAPTLGLPSLSQIVDEGVVVPHVLLWQVGTSLSILIFLLYCVITEMDGLVEILHFIRLRTESKKKRDCLHCNAFQPEYLR